MSDANDDSQRSKARNKHKKKSQKKHTNVKHNPSSRAKKKKTESAKRKSGHKPPGVMKESVREQKMKAIRHSCASTTSDNKTDRSTPKNVIVQQREVDDDEVNKLVEKYKTKKDYCIVPKTNIKKYIQLDQRIKMKATVPILHRKKSIKKVKEGTPNGNNEEKDTDGTTSTTPTSRTPSKTVSSRNPVDISPIVVKEAEEDKYDSYPKIDEVLKLPPEDIYNGEVNPSWMIYLEPFDDDLKDTEPPCTVGSEQIEMYHAKKFKLHIAPEQKLILDQWESSAVLIARNELFFTAPLVFSNTIRSLINVASAKTEKKDKPSQSKPDDKPISIDVVELDRAKCFIYSRANPIISVAEKNYMKPEDIPCIEDLSMHASKFKKQ